MLKIYAQIVGQTREEEEWGGGGTVSWSANSKSKSKIIAVGLLCRTLLCILCSAAARKDTLKILRAPMPLKYPNESTWRDFPRKCCVGHGHVVRVVVSVAAFIVGHQRKISGKSTRISCPLSGPSPCNCRQAKPFDPFALRLLSALTAALTEL